MRKEYKISDILINKGMKCKEIIGNDKINIGLSKYESASQEKQISNKLIYSNSTREGTHIYYVYK